MSNSDYQQLLLTIQNLAHIDKGTRDAAQALIDAHAQDLVLYQHTLEIIATVAPAEGALLSAIFLVRQLRNHYLNFSLELKEYVQQNLLAIFQRCTDRRIKNQLIQAMIRVIVADFPNSRTFQLCLDSFTAVSVTALSAPTLSMLIQLMYRVFKGLRKSQIVMREHGNQLALQFETKLELMRDLLRLFFNQLQAHQLNALTQVDLECYKFLLKLISQGNGLIEQKRCIQNQFSVKEAILHMESVHTILTQALTTDSLLQQQSTNKEIIYHLRDLLYNYQKFLLQGLKHGTISLQDEYIAIMEYLRRCYFATDVQYTQQQTSVAQSQNEAQDNEIYLQLLQGSQKNDFLESEQYERLVHSEERLLVQSMRLCDMIIRTESQNLSMAVYFDNTESIDRSMGEENQFLSYFNKNYLETLIEFMLSKMVVLRWHDIHTLLTDSEKAYNDANNGPSREVTIRGSAVALLSTFYEFIDDQKLTELVDNMLQEFTSSVAQPGIQVRELLRREAFYYIVQSMFRLLKNQIDFEAWYESVLQQELLQPQPFLKVLRVQILNLVQAYLENSYTVPANLVFTLFQDLVRLLCDSQAQDSCVHLRLQCIRCLVPLLQQSVNLGVQLDNVMFATLQLMQSCVENESKLLILEMLQTLVRATQQLLIPHMKPVYAFLRETWRQHCAGVGNALLAGQTTQQELYDEEDGDEFDSPHATAVQSAILQTLSEIIIKQGVLLEELELVFQVLLKALQSSEECLQEGGLALLYQTVKNFNLAARQNLQLHEHENLLLYSPVCQRYFFALLQECGQLFLTQYHLFPLCILIFVEYTHLKTAEIFQALGETLLSGARTLQGELKDGAFEYLFDAFEYLAIVYTQDAVPYLQRLAVLLCEQARTEENSECLQLRLLRVLGRLYFISYAAGKEAVVAINTQQKQPPANDFLFEFLKLSFENVQRLKPDLSMYRYHCVLLLSYLSTLLDDEEALIAAFSSINLQSQQGSVNQINPAFKINTCFQMLVTNIETITQFYEHSLVDESHWILNNLEAISKNTTSSTIVQQGEQLIDPLQIRLLASRHILEVLRQDPLKKQKFQDQARAFYQRIKGHNIQLDTQLEQLLQSMSV